MCFRIEEKAEAHGIRNEGQVQVSRLTVKLACKPDSNSSSSADPWTNSPAASNWCPVPFELDLPFKPSVLVVVKRSSNLLVTVQCQSVSLNRSKGNTFTFNRTHIQIVHKQYNCHLLRHTVCITLYKRVQLTIESHSLILIHLFFRRFTHTQTVHTDSGYTAVQVTVLMLARGVVSRWYNDDYLRVMHTVQESGREKERLTLQSHRICYWSGKLLSLALQYELSSLSQVHPRVCVL